VGDWRDLAACTHIPTSAFYGKASTTGAKAVAPQEIISPAIEQACGSCPVRRDCLEHALANDEPGIWGGMTSAQRRKERRRRDRQRAAEVQRRVERWKAS
jgi:WhiB family redox-sensing transcriptional regulator